MLLLLAGRLLLCLGVVVVTGAQVPLDDDLRLTEWTGTGQGRLEVFHNGSWGTVCDDDFGSEEAGVACWQLGYGRHDNSYSTIGVEGSNPPIFLDDLACQGSEQRLADCQHRPWGVSNCKAEEHIALDCRADPCRSGLCLNGATCIALDDVNVTCHCSDVTEGQWCQYSPSVEVRCGQTMEVALPRRHWPGLHEQYITLANQSCVAGGNATHHVNHGFIFDNRIVTRESPVAGLVSRVRDVNMTIRCHYDDDIFLDNWYIVNSDGIHFTDVARGHYQLSMDLFHNGNKYVAGHPNEPVEPGEKLSIKFSLSTNDSSLQVFARNCKASPSGAQDASQYLFLDDGCGKDPTFHDNRTSNSQETLELQAFQFLPHNASTSSSPLLMHCDVIVCNVTDPHNRCTQGCLTGSDAGDDVTVTEDGMLTTLLE